MAWVGTVVLADNGGNKTTKKYVLSAADYAQAAADFETIRNALDDVTGCTIQKYTLAESVETGAGLPNDDGVQVENRAEISCELVGKSQKYTLDIPAPRIEIMAGAQGQSANQVNIGNATLNTYFSALASLSVVSDGDSLAGMLFGKRVHRASRRG